MTITMKTPYLPTWLTGATLEQRHAYHAALVSSLAASTVAQAVLQRIEAPDHFCEELLNSAAARRFNRPVDVRNVHWLLRHHRFDPNPNAVIAQHTGTVRQNLLAASLANFSVQHAQPQGLGIGSQINGLAVEPHAWAALCREVDAGAHYQQHLLTVLQEGAQALRSAQRAELQTQARAGELRGYLDGAARQVILDALQAPRPAVLWQGRALRVSTLRILASWTRQGTRVWHALVIERQGEEEGDCVVYLPGDPLHPLRQYSSFAAFSQALRERLREPSYRTWFEGLLAEADRAECGQRLQRTLSPLPLFSSTRAPDPEADIGLRREPAHEDLVAVLYDQLHSRLMGDGQTLLVPTAEVDRQVLVAQHKRALASGLNLLNAAALFVPGLGVLMLGVAAAQLIEQSVVGLDDWTHGQTREALAQALSVGQNLALMGINAGAGALASRALAPTPLSPAWLAAVREGGASDPGPLAPLAQPLQRDFPGLPTAAANALAAAANTRERQQLQQTGRVPLRLAEQARVALREQRINRALGGLVWPSARTVDSERLLAGLQAMPEFPNANLLEWARQHPEHCAQLLGMRPRWSAWFAPVRQADGRLGYALSGRGPALPDPVLERLAALYPSLARAQLEDMRLDLGVDPLPTLARLESQFAQLQVNLDHWAQTPATYLNAEGTLTQVSAQDRAQVAGHILAAWRLESPTARSLRGLHQVPLLDLSEWRVGLLPTLGVRLEHVGCLMLDDMALSEDPSAFLQSFPNLESLEITGNQLTVIPEAVAQMQSLRLLRIGNNRLAPSPDLFVPLFDLPCLQRLSLSGNRLHLPLLAWNMLGTLDTLVDLHLNHMGLQLGEGAFSQLARLPNLQVLSLADNDIRMTTASSAELGRLNHLTVLTLSRNPIGAGLHLSGLSALQFLELNDCHLSDWPPGLSELMNRQPRQLVEVDLRNNTISEVPTLADLALFTPPSPYAPLRISREGLSVQSLEHLAQAGIESDGDSQDNDWTSGASQPVLEAITELRATAAARHFMQALDRASEMATFMRNPAAQRRRLWALIEALTHPATPDQGIGQADLREQVYSIGEEVMTTCGDGIELIVQRCETLVQVYQVACAAGDAEQTLAVLLQLAGRLLRAALLDEVAVSITQRRLDRRAALFPSAAVRGVTDSELLAVTEAQQTAAPRLDPLDDLDLRGLMRGPDEADFMLALRMRLQAPLTLLEQPALMLYEQVISDHLLARITDRVLAQDTPQRRLEWLVEQSWWRDFLQRYRSDTWQALRDEWNQGYLFIFEQGREQPEPVDLSSAVRAVLSDVGDEPGRLAGRLTFAEQEWLRQRLDTAWARVQGQWVRAQTEEVISRP